MQSRELTPVLWALPDTFVCFSSSHGYVVPGSEKEKCPWAALQASDLTDIQTRQRVRRALLLEMIFSAALAPALFVYFPQVASTGWFLQYRWNETGHKACTQLVLLWFNITSETEHKKLLIISGFHGEAHVCDCFIHPAKENKQMHTGLY